MPDALDRLATFLGIEPGYHEISGAHRAVSPDTKRALIAAMGIDAATSSAASESLRRLEAEALERALPPVLVLDAEAADRVPLDRPAGPASCVVCLEEGGERSGRLAKDAATVALGAPLPAGYHQLRLETTGATHETVLIVAPRRCVLPAEAGAARGFGVTAQAYGLRSGRNAGIGDFEDVARLAEALGREGSDLLGLNPLHALFPADPGIYSPYQPSSRRFLNVMMIALDAAAAAIGEPLPELAAIGDDAGLVDYAAVAPAKRRALEALWRAFRAHSLAHEGVGGPGRAFLDWRRAGGDALERHCRFDALHEHMLGQDPALAVWRCWPSGLRDPASREVGAFAAAHAERIAFFAWLQWLADRQLEAAHARGRAAGMRIGLYRDLAIGVSPKGSTAWAEQALTLAGATIGAPPDELGPQGQNWDIAPLSPFALRERAYAPLIQDLRANMRHAGALRIDHVMGLSRLFWIPTGGSAADGAYVRYPFRDLRRILALESRRQRCVVIGEDLGTVPAGFRDAMAESGVLSYRVAWFERDPSGDFLPPDAYPAQALASVSTHDLPTVRGFWAGRDIAWRERLGVFTAEQAEAERRRRDQDIRRLSAALEREGLLPAEGGADGPDAAAVAEAIHRFLARTPAALVLVQLEDLAGEAEQPNLPGTIESHPNWRRRLRLALEDLLQDRLARRVLAAVREERQRPA
ncbi:MAG TPA: 4-alpha-glucanotransferase [Geminicoccaceae bacterium]|nr:4-alpha-glucanotransferase [Geminicoccaceae bacterium]